MADADESSPSSRQKDHVDPSPSHLPEEQQNPQVVSSARATAIDIAKPWLLYTTEQAQELRRTVAQSTDSALQSARSQLGELQSASSHHLRSAQDIFQTVQSQYGQYEHLFFGKLKEGLQSAGNHPGISYSFLAGSGLLLMKRPRRLLFRHTIGRFQSDESALLSSERKVKEMRQSVDILNNESQKLQERARFAEEELRRGQTKLKHAGSQLQNLINSIQKTEGQARGLMDSLRELPGRDALRFRAEVGSMVAEARQQRTMLDKKITKIANYGISV